MKYNKHYNYKNDEALNVLKNLWNDDFQGKYSASLNNPNANLTILIPEELFTDRYIIKNYDVNDDLVTLYRILKKSRDKTDEKCTIKNSN